MEIKVPLKEIILEKIEKLPLSYQREELDFINFLQSKVRHSEILFLSESSLSEGMVVA